MRRGHRPAVQVQAASGVVLGTSPAAVAPVPCFANPAEGLDRIKDSVKQYPAIFAEEEGFPSGQRDQTVNLTRKLRWFESTPLHHGNAWAGVVGEMGDRDAAQEYAMRTPERVAGCGYSSVAEPQPSKLKMRVRFPLPAPGLARVRVRARTRTRGSAHIAQLVEHFLGKEEVTGSNPVMSSSLSMRQGATPERGTAI